MLCVIFILLYISDELSYDRYFVLHERIYRLESVIEVSGKQQKVVKTPFPFGPAL